MAVAVSQAVAYVQVFIRELKRQQWRGAYYALLIHASLFGLKVFADDQTSVIK